MRDHWLRIEFPNYIMWVLISDITESYAVLTDG